MARENGFDAVGLGVLCGVLTGRAGNFAIRWMDSRISVVCDGDRQASSGEEPGCGVQIAVLGLILLILAVPLLSTQLAGQLALSLSSP